MSTTHCAPCRAFIPGNPLGEREKGVFEYLVEPENGADIRRDVFRIAAEKNWPILSMKSTEMSLEEIFLKLTSGGVCAPTQAGARFQAG